jgi:pilus assembly protein CpaF
MLDQFQPSPEQIKILLVDDMLINAQLLAEILEEEGFKTAIATSGQEALEKVVSEKPNLVILDVMMPYMDGFEVCRRIKNNPGTLFLPVILVTALSAVEHRVKGAKAGADEFISKPPDEQELLSRIRSLTRIQFLHNALEARNRELKEVLEERTRQLEEATQELQKLLEEKAHFSPELVPAAYLSPLPSTESPSGPAQPAVAERGSEPVDQQATRDFKRCLMSRLSDSLEGRTDLSRTPEMVSSISQRLAAIYEASGLRLPDEARQRLFREIVDDIVGYGPIEPLLADPTITEVMVNNPHLIYIEQKGRLSKTTIQFDDDDHALRIIDRIIRPLGRRVDRKFPMVDARLPDGSRVNAIIPPCALDGPAITIRKFSKDRLTVNDLISFGSLTSEMASFLEACVHSRVNIIVSGGTGSGKTTLLNVLSSFIPEEERIVTIEDSAELQLCQEHVVRLESKPADVDGSGEVTIRQLVKNSLRMRPDRVVVGEVRGGEALDMLQAMNTGHDGSLTTIHANSPRDTVARLETLILMAGMELPLKVVRAQITSAIDLIVQQARLRDGSRKVIGITEVQGMEGDVVVLSDIFVFKEKGMQDDRVVGELLPTGIRPKFTEKLEVHGYDLPADVFMTRAQQEQLGNTRRK